MLKTHIAACLLTTALITAPALAQTNPAPNANQPAGRTQANPGQFLTQESPDQWRGSKLVGLSVYGPNNERIGDINEVLVDRNGKVDAVVIGVGGFLGIGEKDVALPFSQVKFVDQARDTRAGTVELAIPKLRQGSYFPDWLLQHRRSAPTSSCTASYVRFAASI